MRNSLWIDDEAWALTHELANELSPLETGGVLLGYRGTTGEHVVTAIVGPGRRAKHRRYRFAPDHDDQLAIMDAHFAKTDGRESYLGDWHTHPNGACAPSTRDKRVLHRIASTPTSGTKHPVMMILAGLADGWQVCAVRFEFRRRRFIGYHYELSPLVPRVYSE